MYGLPKSPGRIQYDPRRSARSEAILRIFDADPSYSPTSGPEKRFKPRAGIQLTRREPTRFEGLLDNYFGRFVESIVGIHRDLFGTPWRKKEDAEKKDAEKKERDIGEEFEVVTPGLRIPKRSKQELERLGIRGPTEKDVDVHAVTLDKSLQLLAPLLGLKQFPHPDPAAGACYRAVVRSQVESKIHRAYVFLSGYRAHFPALQRLDLPKVYGAKLKSGRRHVDPIVFYQQSTAKYSEPGTTKVWPATGRRGGSR